MRARQHIQVKNKESKPPKVAIIVLNWNGWRDTIECLESARRLTYRNFQVIVVDNGSTDRSVDELRAWICRTGRKDGLRARVQPQDAKFVMVENAENLGFSGGVNLGIERALAATSPSEFMFLLNNDAWLEASAITQCVKVSLDQDAAIVGAVIRSASGAEVLFAGARFPRELFLAGGAVVTTNVEDRKRCWPSARAEATGMLIRRDVIEARLREVGYVLNPALFMYFEETDLCEWARARGYPVLISGGAVVYHGLGRSAGGWGSPVMHYYLTRNRILLARRLLPGPQRLAFHLWFFASRMIRAAERLLRGQPSVASAILHGIWDGYRVVTGRWAKHPSSREPWVPPRPTARM